MTKRTIVYHDRNGSIRIRNQLVSRYDPVMTMFQPEKFGKYRILTRVDVGPVAESYQATTLDENGAEQPVIIKKILSHLASDPTFARSFMERLKLASVLRHQNIIRVFDFGETDGAYFVAAESLSGETLQDIIQASEAQMKPLGLEKALHITAQICSALDYAHNLVDFQKTSQNAVHTHINPQTIFMTREGRVKIADFGLHALESRDASTQMGIMKGKFAYMSPEQVDGQTVDHRTDIFSTGILLYEMITRKKAFEGETMQVFSNVRQAKFEAPENIVSGLPPKVYEIIHRALEKDPRSRYQSADELLADLGEVVLAEPTLQQDESGVAQYVKTLFPENTHRAKPVRRDDFMPRTTELPAGKSPEENPTAQAVGPVHSEAKTGVQEKEQRPPIKGEQDDSPKRRFEAAPPPRSAVRQEGSTTSRPDRKPPPNQTTQTVLAGQGKSAASVKAGASVLNRTQDMKPDRDKESKEAVPHDLPPPEKSGRQRGKGLWFASVGVALVIICAGLVLVLKNGTTNKHSSSLSPKVGAGMEALEAGRFSEAAGLFDEVLAGEPSMLNEVSRAYARALQGQASGIAETDHKKAEALLLMAVEYDPESVQAFSQLGLLYVKHKDFTKAADAYQRAARLNPESADTFFNLGYVYAVRKDYEKAEDMYKQVVGLAPPFLDEALFNLAMVQERLGKRKAFIKNLGEAIEVNPDNKQARKYLQALKG